MKILSLALTNIKSYRGTQVFPRLAPGVLLLLGRNGCGKSTIPQAIGLSAFGARPTEFQGKGSSLVGFVNRKESAGAIRVVVEIRPDRVLTFDTRLTVKAPTGEQLDPTNLVRTDVYEGARALEGDLNRAEAWRDHLTLDHIAELIQAELGAREKGADLYGTLLSPSQAGGLTAYLSETPKKRQDQTERILGLQTVKKVGEVLRKRCTSRKTEADVLRDQLRDALTSTSERYEALAPMLETHSHTTVPFEALTEGELRAAGTAARAPLVSAAATQAREVVLAQRALKDATAHAARLGGLSEAARQIVERFVARDTAQKEVTESEAAVTRAAELAEDAKRWDAANAEVEALTKRQQERDRGVARIDRAIAEARKDLKLIDTQAEARAAERARIAAQAAEEKAALEGKLEAFADWETRQKENAGELEALDTARTDLEVLSQLLAACAGIDNLDAPQDKLAQLEAALGQGRLPEDARDLVTTIGEQLAAVGGGEAPTQATSASEQVKAWQVANTTERTRSQQVERSLTAEKASVDSAMRAAGAADKRRAERLQTLDREDADATGKRKETAAAITQHEADLKALHEAYAGLDEALAKARATRDDPTLAARKQAWVVASARAALLPRHQEALVAAQATVQTALDAFTALAPGVELPEDTEGWRARRDELEGKERAAQDARMAATAAVGDARSELEDAHEDIDALKAALDDLCTRRATLEQKRASHRELKTLLDTVISPLPRSVASRVVERVSTLANDFFQELFVLPAEPTSISWKTSDYEVRLTRGEESIPAKHASGGEKMAIGISLNLALIHYMAPEVRWLVLDEPTASLDVENREGLKDVVERLREPMDDGQRLFDQLLFISHESALFEGLGDALDFSPGSED